MRIFFFLLFLPSTILAQQNSTFGTVSGHVYCSDTQLPARLGRIVLSPIPDPPAAGPAAKKEQSEPRIVFAEIGLDGSFLFPHVTPGNYYVVADRPGYIAPESQFTDAEIGSLAPEMRELIAKSVPTISVVENKTTTIDVHLHRGGAVSGILRYDDGSPVPFVQLDILRHDKSGQWVPLDTGVPALTDDLGHFRISGLPAGEYILSSGFNSQDVLSIFGESDKPLNIYYGDVFFRKDAKRSRSAMEKIARATTSPFPSPSSTPSPAPCATSPDTSSTPAKSPSTPCRTTSRSSALRSNRRTPPFTWISFPRAITSCA
jgi:hypothetical protein